MKSHSEINFSEDKKRIAMPATLTFSRFRWGILILFLVGVTVNYLTRNSLGILAPELKNTLHMSTQQYSWVVAAFQFAYTIFQPICGWFIDVLGVKIGFLICGLVWSLMCLLHAGARNWIHLAILRFFMGAAEASATPSTTKLISDWFPKKEWSVASGWAGVGFSIGAMLAPPLVVVAHQYIGWQGAFIFCGVIALIWCLLWFFLYQTPNRTCDDTLLQSTNNHYSFFKSIKLVGRERRFYGIAIAAFLAEPAWSVLSFWVPLYLANQRGMDLKHIAMFAWLPFLAADLGSIASGYLAKLYRRYFGSTEINSAVISSVTGAFLMLSLALVAFTDSPYVAILLISIGGFGHQIISCMLTSLVVNTFEPEKVATVNGMRGFFAWIASTLFTLLIGAISDKIGFNPLFIAMGFFDLVGAIFLIKFIVERRVQPEITKP